MLELGYKYIKRFLKKKQYIEALRLITCIMDSLEMYDLDSNSILKIEYGKAKRYYDFTRMKMMLESARKSTIESIIERSMTTLY